MTTASPRPASRPSARRSLNWRLTISIVVIVFVAMLVFGLAAFRQVVMSSLNANIDRAQSVAEQIADLQERNIRGNRGELRQMLTRPELRTFLQHPENADLAERLRSQPATLQTAAGIRRLEIWNDSGVRLLEIVRTSPGFESADELPRADRPTAIGLAPLRASGNTIYSEDVDEVRDGESDDSPRLGFLVIRATLAMNRGSAVSRLVGRNAVILVGNRSGDLWADLSASRRVDAPPVDLRNPGPAHYRSASGDWRLGSLANVGNTPLAVWVEFPRSTVVAPALAFLYPMSAVGLILLVGGSLTIQFVLRRMTRPLAELTGAAESIAAGDYTQRVPELTRRDEIGRLSDAFNSMAKRVESTHERLEARVQERTAALDALQGAKTALAESERVFRSTFDDAPLGIAQVSVDGTWIRVNRRLESVLGRSSDELVGASLFDIFHPDDLAALRGSVDGRAGREERVRRKDGQFVWVHLTISPIRTSSGEPRHLVVILEDVSERRRLEERLRESEKLEAIGRLAGGVAHDFNNLLTAILGYAQLLADSIGPGDPNAGNAEEIIKAAERSAALTGQLLAFSRKQVLVPATLDLNALLRDTAILLRRVIGEHIELVTTMAPDLEAISADRTQIEQIVVNLAVNGRDAMPSGGRLTIETANVVVGSNSTSEPCVTEPGRYVMLAVTDTGVGMDADTKLRVFEPFFTTKEQGRGTGLGLATVYGIVKQSGGYIGVYSEPQEGATFKVYFPAVPGAKASAERRTGSRTACPGTETILVVEDERAVRRMTRLILERAGYNVVEAAAPDEAQDIARSHSPKIDLMISDVLMPGSNGPALFERLSMEQPSLRVLYMSGHPDHDVAYAGRLERAQDFMEKPFTSQTLLEKVREILDRQPS